MITSQDSMPAFVSKLSSRTTSTWIAIGRSLGLIPTTLCVVALLATSAQAADVAPEPPGRKHKPRMSFIENGSIRLGVDLELGGAITCLAPATNPSLNLINSYDWGRQVQLSYYSGPIPFQPPGAKMSTNWQFLGWNPIQAGDCCGFKPRILQHTNDGRSLYTKCVPMQWPLRNVPGECEFEVWLELNGPAVKARCRLTNHRADHTQYAGRTQEAPAVYVNGPYHRLLTYRGDRPFTGGELSQINIRLDKDGRWDSWLATENWAAQVNDAGWGLGVWNPAACRFSGGFFQEPGTGGPTDAPTGYIAPNQEEILDHNIVHDYRYELILGTIAEIRAHVYRRAGGIKVPAYRFIQDRQGWRYADATDAGWPIRGELDIQLTGPDPQVISPEFFVRAADAPKLVLDAAFSTGGTNAVIFWRTYGDQGFSEGQSLTFPVVPDGAFHRVTIDLSAVPAWRGAITQLRLDPVATGGKDARLRLRSVSFEK